MAGHQHEVDHKEEPEKLRIPSDFNSQWLQTLSKVLIKLVTIVWMFQRCAGINTLVLDEHIPTFDDRDENGRGDDKDTNKEKENIASKSTSCSCLQIRGGGRLSEGRKKKAGAEKRKWL